MYDMILLFCAAVHQQMAVYMVGGAYLLCMGLGGGAGACRGGGRAGAIARGGRGGSEQSHAVVAALRALVDVALRALVDVELRLVAELLVVILSESCAPVLLIDVLDA